MKKYFGYFFVLQLCLIRAQTPYLVKDIYPGIKSGFFESPAGAGVNLNPINNGVIFRATREGFKNLLWYSDGSTTGTFPLDTNLFVSGPLDSTCFFNGKYFLKASTPALGVELFSTDGTVIGTKVLKDINLGSNSSSPRIINRTSNKMYFIATDGITGNELYCTDGTTAGTSFLKDIEPGTNGFGSTNLLIINTINDSFYFIATTTANGSELWFTDGTTPGTKLVQDIWPGAGSSVNLFTKYIKGTGNNIFFVANDGTNGEELWFSNGTSAYLVKNIRSGTATSNISFLSIDNNILYFMADDGVNGKELWRSDGTFTGTYLLHDIEPGSGSAAVSLTNNNNKAYYLARSSTNKFSIWESDGTVSGTYSVSIPSISTYTSSNYWCSDIFKFNNSVYFTVSRYSNVYSVYDSIFFYKISSGLSSLNNFFKCKNEHEYFGGFCITGNFSPISPTLFRYQYSDYGTTDYRQNIISDGSNLNTFVCANFSAPLNENNCDQFDYIILNNDLISMGTTSLQASSSLIYSNSLLNGSAQFLSNSIWPAPFTGGGYNNLFPRIKHNNLLYFRGGAPSIGYELCVTDGLASGTGLVLDIFPGANSSLDPEILYFTALSDRFVAASSGSKLFFLANDGVVGTELWCIGGLSGVKENELSKFVFNSFPNPTKNSITINLSDNFIDGIIELTDILGRSIDTKSIKNTSEKLTFTLNPGVYLIKVVSKTGYTLTNKIIVE